MKIECILIRKGGTKVDLDGEQYHFKPDAKGRHIAEVENPDHIGTLLSIKEGYRIVQDEKSEEGDGLDALDKVGLSRRYAEVLGEAPSGSLSRARLIEAIRNASA